MKKLLALVLALCMVFALAACAQKNEPASEPETETATETETEAQPAEETPAEEAQQPAEGEAQEETGEEEVIEAEFPEPMTYAEFLAADVDTPVTVETYVQGHQSWWDGKVNVYTENEEGGYFLYEMACSEEDAEKLVAGTKLLVNGYKSEWAGELEIVDATYTIEDGDTYVAEPVDVTELLGTDELANNMNRLVSFKDMTVEAYDETGAAFVYKDPEGKTDDLYFKASKDGNVYDFCVEFYLTGSDTDVYKAVEGLNVGDTVDLTGFLYWYNGVNPHITEVVVK